MKKLPPNMNKEELEKEKRKFIEEPIGKTSTDSYPWEANNVRDDVFKFVNLRLKEKDFLKLKYLSEQTKESMQSICRGKIEKGIAENLKKFFEKN